MFLERQKHMYQVQQDILIYNEFQDVVFNPLENDFSAISSAGRKKERIPKMMGSLSVFV